MDQTFASVVPRVQTAVQGCPYPTILQYIRDAAIKACERTLAWRYEVPKFDLLPGVHQYYYRKPANADVHAVFEVTINDRVIPRLTLEQAIAKHPEWADLYSGNDPWALTSQSLVGQTEYNEALYNPGSVYEMPPEIVEKASSPQSFTQVTPDKYIVLPLPDDLTYTVRMWVALKPKRTATGMEEAAFADLEDTIVHGALQHLYALPNTAWHEKELAAYHAKQFLYHLTERRARANVGNARGTLVARAQPFA
jgi:hypothetical protein